MKELIKKILREGILDEELIQENYATNQELEKLTKELLAVWVKIWYRNNEVDLNFDVDTNSFIEPYDYDVLQDFLRDCNFKIRFSRFMKISKGEFERHHNNHRYGIIGLRMQDHEYERIKREIETYDGKTDHDYSRLVYWCTEQFESTLLHELQHAYDAWRSKGKFADDQDRLEFQMKNYKMRKALNKKGDTLTQQDHNDVMSYNKAYLRLTHEINARFTQSVRDMRVWVVDWNKSQDDIIQSLKPWEDYYGEFKRSFRGWEVMKVKVKKNLIRRLAKVYKDSAEAFLAQQKNENNS